MLIFLACGVYYVGNMFLYGILRMKLMFKYGFKPNGKLLIIKLLKLLS
jgi:hypothetical protein